MLMLDLNKCKKMKPLRLIIYALNMFFKLIQMSLFINNNLFSVMIKHAYVPDQLGLGAVIPLLKDESGDLSNLDNYCVTSVSLVFSKIFELCFSSKFGSYFYSHDLLLGFKKDIGCGPAVSAVQETVNTSLIELALSMQLSWMPPEHLIELIIGYHFVRLQTEMFLHV